MNMFENKSAVRFFLSKRPRKNVLSFLLLEICLPFGLLYLLYSFTENVITEQFVVFSIMIRSFIMAPQTVVDISSQNMLGIYENLACTEWSLKRIVWIESMTHFMTGIFSSFCFCLSNWLVFFFLVGKDIPLAQLLFLVLVSILLNLVFTFLVAGLSVIRGMKFDTAGTLPVAGMVLSVATLTCENVTAQIMIAACYAIVLATIFWGRIRKLTFESLIQM